VWFFHLFVESQLYVNLWIYFWVLYSILLVSLSAFMPVPSCFGSYYHIWLLFVLYFEVRYWDYLSFVLFHQVCLGYFKGLLLFHVDHFFLGYIKCVDCFGLWAFSNIKSSNPWTQYISPFHYLSALLNFFHQLYSVRYSLLPPWLNLFQSILFFVANVNRIAFLISFSAGLPFVYRNTTDFCMLILYHANLLNCWLALSFFGSICMDNFISFFPV
jgi:hypothetical protein